MEVSFFKFSITFKGEKLNASCHKMKVYKHPHLRVAVNRKNGKTDIYIFHETNDPDQKYFWFQLNGIKQEMATVIATKLEKLSAHSN